MLDTHDRVMRLVTLQLHLGLFVHNRLAHDLGWATVRRGIGGRGDDWGRSRTLYPKKGVKVRERMVNERVHALMES